MLASESPALKRTMRSTFSSPWALPPELESAFEQGMIRLAGNHTTMDYQTILSVGFLGLLEQIQERLSRSSPEEPDYQQKRHFLEALQIVAEGYIAFCTRHADLAIALSEQCRDGPRKRELEAIAHNCRTVPDVPGGDSVERH